jgi:hypothetical protein
MVERDWQKIINEIQYYQKIHNFLVFFCYAFIVFAIIFYIVQFSVNNNKIQIVRKSNQDNLSTKKIMLEPRLNFAYDENKIMFVKAHQALYEKDAETILKQVFAEAEIGNITAGELIIKDSGNELVFSDHPVLILNQNSYE